MLTHNRATPQPYASLVEAIKEKPMTVKVAAMTLINTLINHATELDDRIRLRNFMAALDLMEVVEEVLTLPPQEKISDEDDSLILLTSNSPPFKNPFW